MPQNKGYIKKDSINNFIAERLNIPKDGCMKDYIKREEALRQIFLEAMGHNFDFNAEYMEIFMSAKRAIKNTPAADVVEVVRCKDCKHAIIVDDVFHEDEVVCSLLSQDVACNNYCMYGEKGEQWHIGKEEDPYEVREKMDKEE